MLKANSKEVRNKIKMMIWDNAKDYIEEGSDFAEFRNINPDDFTQVCNLLNVVFYLEKIEFDNRFKAGRISRFELFREWVSGLSRAIPNEHYLKDARDIVGEIFQETEEEKARFTSAQAEELLDRLMYDTINRHATRTGIRG